MAARASTSARARGLASGAEAGKEIEHGAVEGLGLIPLGEVTGGREQDELGLRDRPGHDPHGAERGILVVAEVKQLALGGPSTSTGSAVPAAGVGCGGRATIEDPGGIRRILTPRWAPERARAARPRSAASRARHRSRRGHRRLTAGAPRDATRRLAVTRRAAGALEQELPRPYRRCYKTHPLTLDVDIGLQ